MSEVVLAAGAGFLLAVLWFDLMFDVQVLRHRGAAALPEPVLASIAGYYRRVTTEASPMGRLVGLVMLAAIAAAAYLLFAGPGALAQRALALALLLAPVALAAARTVPNAVRLGARGDSAESQSELARAICRDHLVCLASIGALLVLLVARG